MGTAADNGTCAYRKTVMEYLVYPGCRDRVVNHYCGMAARIGTVSNLGRWILCAE